MKKVFVTIIMLVVVLMTAVSMAEARDGIMYGCTYEDSRYIMEDYCEYRGLDDWLIGNDVNGLLYGYGAICKEDFERETGKSWSIENFNEKSKEEFDMEEIYTRVVDEVDGITFYRSTAKSENTPLAYQNNEYYYAVDAVFFVFSRNEN